MRLYKVEKKFNVTLYQLTKAIPYRRRRNESEGIKFKDDRLGGKNRKRRKWENVWKNRENTLGGRGSDEG